MCVHAHEHIHMQPVGCSKMKTQSKAYCLSIEGLTGPESTHCAVTGEASPSGKKANLDALSQTPRAGLSQKLLLIWMTSNV